MSFSIQRGGQLNLLLVPLVERLQALVVQFFTRFTIAQDIGTLWGVILQNHLLPMSFTLSAVQNASFWFWGAHVLR